MSVKGVQMKAPRICLLILTAAAVLALPASAELITFKFTGTVDVVNPPLGGTFSASVTFRPICIAPTDPGSPASSERG